MVVQTVDKLIASCQHVFDFSSSGLASALLGNCSVTIIRRAHTNVSHLFVPPRTIPAFLYCTIFILNEWPRANPAAIQTVCYSIDPGFSKSSRKMLTEMFSAIEMER